MIMQISSGMGPVECRAAVGGIYRELEKEFPDIEMITSTKGEVDGAYSSIIFLQSRTCQRLKELWNGYARASTDRGIRGKTGLWM